MASLRQSIPLVLELDSLTDEMLDMVEDEVFILHNKLLDAGQAVWLSGDFRNGFAPVERLSDTHWIIKNDVDYASILANGRVNVGGRWYGSIKWEHGIDPMLAKMEETINAKQSRMKR